jgi:transcriptional/translational regulatory protein YebC/TACO1
VIYDVAIEAGADDVREDEGTFEILTSPENYETVLAKIKAAGLEPATASITKLPQTTVKLVGSEAETMLKLMEALDDQHDVQQVYANFDISPQQLEAAAIGD